MSSTSPWQCDLHTSKDRDNALFLNERLSDLTITFPLHNISFPAHRLMMAKTSPYFEKLFYGPMAMHEQEWKVKDSNVEPEILKVVLAHCYEVNLLNENIEMTLQVYKLADCYMIDSLKSQCLKCVQDTISNDNDSDFQYILEWSKRYGFFEIVFEILSSKLNFTNSDSEGLPSDKDIHKNISNLLLNLPLEKHKELLSRCEHLDILSFEESWRNPDKILSCEVLMSIFENSRCKNGCNNRYSLLQGCISPRALNHFIRMKNVPLFPPIYHALYVDISIIDVLHYEALYDCIKDLEEDNICIYFAFHIPCKRISLESLAIWSSQTIISLYLSNVDDESVPWAVATTISLKSSVLYLPQSSLSLNGFKSLVKSLESAETNISDIRICSCNMRVEYLEELNTLTEYEIEIHELDDDIYYW